MRRLFVAAVLLAGCELTSAAPTEDCAEIGARCRTPEGPLGVCVARDDDCEAPPCLFCQPQH